MEKNIEKLIINKIPSPTWSWLKMNRAEIEKSVLPVKFGNFLPEARGISDKIKYSETGSEKAENIQKMTGGTGAGAEALFDGASPVSITSAKDSKTQQPVVLEYDFSENSSISTSQIIHAEENSSVNVIIVSSSAPDAAGFQAQKTQIYAEKNAKVHLIKIQILGNRFIQADETATYCEENAEINVRHIILGGTKTYMGTGGTLSGNKSSFRSDCAYFCRNEQVLDMNYIVLQYGKKTDCKMTVKGTLRDKARKTYRGTIDFKNGCSGSTGNEQEETLILSPDVVNNSIPVILCDEEDVAGEHGASIGRLGEDVLFYMRSRGISKKTAENIIAKAKIQTLLDSVEDEQTVQKTCGFLNSLFGQE